MRREISEDELTELNKDLFNAVACNDKTKVKELIENGADVNAIVIQTNIFSRLFTSKETTIDTQDKYVGCTPIHIAVINKYYDVAEILLDNGADIRNISNKGLSILHYEFIDNQTDWNSLSIAFLATFWSTIMSGAVTIFFGELVAIGAMSIVGTTGIAISVPILVIKGIKKLADDTITYEENTSDKYLENGLKYLIAKGANINYATKHSKKEYEGYTPLHFAILKKFYNKAQILLNQPEIDIHIITSSGMTLLHCAVQSEYFDIVEDLIARGINIDATCNDTKYTALHFAIMSKNQKIIKKLIEKGADVNAATSDGSTSLLFAVMESDININLIKDLIAAGANTNAKTSSGLISLHLAISKNNPNIDLINILIAAGANINAKLQCGKFKNYTPLYIAIKEKHIDIAERLSEHPNINPNIATPNKGYTLLHCAARAGYLNVVKNLIKAGANANLKIIQGVCENYTALHFAIKNYSGISLDQTIEMIKVLEPHTICPAILIALSFKKIDIAAKLIETLTTFDHEIPNYIEQLFWSSDKERLNKLIDKRKTELLKEAQAREAQIKKAAQEREEILKRKKEEVEKKAEQDRKEKEKVEEELAQQISQTMQFKKKTYEAKARAQTAEEKIEQERLAKEEALKNAEQERLAKEKAEQEAKRMKVEKNATEARNKILEEEFINKSEVECAQLTKNSLIYEANAKSYVGRLERYKKDFHNGQKKINKLKKEIKDYEKDLAEVETAEAEAFIKKEIYKIQKQISLYKEYCEKLQEKINITQNKIENNSEYITETQSRLDTLFSQAEKTVISDTDIHFNLKRPTSEEINNMNLQFQQCKNQNSLLEEELFNTNTEDIMFDSYGTQNKADSSNASKLNSVKLQESKMNLSNVLGEQIERSTDKNFKVYDKQSNNTIIPFDSEENIENSFTVLGNTSNLDQTNIENLFTALGNTSNLNE
ncbi:MAG: ankyrin repeat domain-containing protein [Rickettsiales bacterium]